MKITVTLLLFFLLLLNAGELSAVEQITLQLKWTHAFQFAGYYAALEKGYYQDAGLDITILEAEPEFDVVQRVMADEAQYGVGSSGLLLERAAGIPVMVLAVIFQHSPYEIYAAPEIQQLTAIRGEKIMLEPHSEELTAFLVKSGVDLNELVILPHSFDANSLINGEVKAMSGYISSEPYYFKKAKYPYQTFNPRSVGIDFYGDNLFTSEKEIEENPERVKAFLAASLKGWQYAKENPEEIIDLIHNRYSQIHTKDFLRYESEQMIPLLQPDLIEIGYMNPNRWRHIANTYAELQLLPENYPLTGFVYTEKKQDLTLIYRGLGLAVFLILLVSIIAAYIFRVNRRLSSSLLKIRQINTALIESERSYYGLFNSINEAIYIQDDKGFFIDVNSGVEEMYGYTRDEVIGKTPEFLSAPGKNDLEQIIGFVKKAFETGKPQVFEFWGKRKNGEIFPKDVILNKSKYFGKDVIVAAARDITDRKRAQDLILRSSERVKILNKIIRHDLSNDLTVLKSAVNLFKKDPDKELLNALEERIDKSLQTISEYKGYEYFLNSNSELMEFEISEIIRESIIDFPMIKFSLHGSCMIFAHEAIKSVFSNLISNSLNHGNSSEITINITSDKDSCYVDFSDNGNGIPEEIRTRIFEEGFHSGDTGNTGMGLYIADKTLKNIGGSIVLSEKQQDGAHFIIRFKKVYK